MSRYRKQRLYTLKIDNKVYQCRNSKRIELVGKVKHDLTSSIKVCIFEEPIDYYSNHKIRIKTAYVKTVKIVDTGFYNLIIEKIDDEYTNKKIIFVKNEDNQGIVVRIL